MWRSIWNTVGATEERDRDAAAFQAAELAAQQAACKLTGSLFEYATPGALEDQIARLEAEDAPAAAP